MIEADGVYGAAIFAGTSSSSDPVEITSLRRWLTSGGRLGRRRLPRCRPLCLRLQPKRQPLAAERRKARVAKRVDVLTQAIQDSVGALDARAHRLSRTGVRNIACSRDHRKIHDERKKRKYHVTHIGSHPLAGSRQILLLSCICNCNQGWRRLAGEPRRKRPAGASRETSPRAPAPFRCSIGPDGTRLTSSTSPAISPRSSCPRARSRTEPDREHLAVPARQVALGVWSRNELVGIDFEDRGNFRW